MIEYVSVNDKVKKIMIFVEISLIIFYIAGINATLFLPALAHNTTLYFQSDTSNLILAT